VNRRRIVGFVDERGRWRELSDPHGAPTGRQLLALWRAGALALVGFDPRHRFSKSEAAATIDDAVVLGFLDRRQTPDPAERFDRTCAAIVAHVAANPGCTASSVCEAVRTAGVGYVNARVRDLIDLAVLEDRAPRQGQGRRRQLWYSDRGDA
jgi:hypothetical protein